MAPDPAASPSYIFSTKDAIEDVAAKIASTSADAASLAGQIAFSDSGLAAASAVRSQTQQFQRVTKDRLDKECVLLGTLDESQHFLYFQCFFYIFIFSFFYFLFCFCWECFFQLFFHFFNFSFFIFPILS